jgi:hypothetical protein
VADIFVSYTSNDRDWAFWIGQELGKLKHKPRVHEWEIPAGGDVARKKSVGRANQRSEHQGEQQAEQPHDRPDHVSRAGGHVAFGHEPLQIKSKKADAKRQDPDSERNKDVRHGYPPPTGRLALRMRQSLAPASRDFAGVAPQEVETRRRSG